MLAQPSAGYTLEAIDQDGKTHLRRIYDQQVNVVVLAVAFLQLGSEVATHFGEDHRKVFDRRCRQHIASVFRAKDQVRMNAIDNVSAGSDVLHDAVRPIMSEDMILTYRFRVKDKTSAKNLRRMASAVNYAWNYCCATQREAQRRHARWPSRYDFVRLMTGASAELGIHSDTLGAIARQFVDSRSAARCCPAWRSRKRGALGWMPFNAARAFRIDAASGSVVVLGRKYRLWFSRPIPADAKIKTACFAEDSRGRWYFNVQIEVVEAAAKNGAAVAIDLGLKDLAALSDGSKIKMPAFYLRHEARLALAQQRQQPHRVTALHAKVKNCRRHFLHQESTRIVRKHARVIVGDVNAAGLAKTRMAKSVLDAGWSTFRTMLQYKCLGAGAAFEIVSEKWTTQTCSDCGVVGGPKGIAGLGIRHWACSDCGALHDRDVNAARNLLLFAGAERRPPAAEIPSLQAGEDVKRPSGLR
jgi:putative transposase